MHRLDVQRQAARVRRERDTRLELVLEVLQLFIRSLRRAAREHRAQELGRGPRVAERLVVAPVEREVERDRAAASLLRKQRRLDAALELHALRALLDVVER